MPTRRSDTAITVSTSAAANLGRPRGADRRIRSYLADAETWCSALRAAAASRASYNPATGMLTLTRSGELGAIPGRRAVAVLTYTVQIPDNSHVTGF